MRFSIKWMLAAVGYVALVCASLASPSSAWVVVLGGAALAGFAAAVVGLFVLPKPARSFCIGLLVFALFANATLIQRDRSPLDAVFPVRDLGDAGEELLVATLARVNLRDEVDRRVIRELFAGRPTAVAPIPGQVGQLALVAFSYGADSESATIERSLSPWNADMAVWLFHAMVVLKLHAILLCSFFGGQVGLQFHRVETHQAESTPI